MQIDFEQKELEYLNKVVSKTLKASRKNLLLTKDEEQKQVICKSIVEKEKLLKKIRNSLKNI